MNRADGDSEIEGKAAKGSGERVGKGASFNRADGNSDTEGKAAKGSGERGGSLASFKSAKPVRRSLGRRRIRGLNLFSENFRKI